MRHLLKIVFVILISLFSEAKSQIVSSDFNFHETKISNSGCSYELPFSNIEFEKSFSEDSSILWTNESESGNYIFGIILVKLNEALDIEDDALGLLESYLDFLKGEWGVTGAKGYNQTIKLKSNSDVIGIQDTWSINDDLTAIQSWINNQFLVVMYIDGNNIADHVSETYFQGFQFAK